MSRLREERKKHGFTMKEVGSMIGVTEASVSLYETDKRTPDFDMLKKLSEIYGTSIEYLMGLENESTAKAKIEEKIDKELVNILSGLSESEIQRVRDFVAGMKSRQ